MQVMFQHHTRFVVVVVVGFTLVTAGCRSTRNGLSGLPGMGWLATSDSDSFPGWSGDASEPGLPPPSEQATPQVTSNRDTRSADGYADTGYPSPYGEQGTRRSGSYPIGNDRPDQRLSDTGGPAASNTASVGSTQQGFYGEDYSDNDTPYEEPPAYGDTTPPYGETVDDVSSGPKTYDDGSKTYDQYSEPYAPPQDGYAADADPNFERLGQSPEVGVDPQGVDAATDLDFPQEGDSDLRGGYQRLSQGVRDTIRDGADSLTEGAERVQSFARDQASSVRDTVKDGYGRFTGDADPSEFGPGDPANFAAGDEPYSDYPADQGDYPPSDYPPADDGHFEDPLPDYPSTSDGEYANSTSQEPYDNQPGDVVRELAPPTHDTHADLNSPRNDGYGPSSPAAGGTNMPRRSSTPWRPGSTGGHRVIGNDETRLPPNGQNVVRPASYPVRNADRRAADSSAYPDHGWQSNPSGADQRLSPNYR